MQTKRNDSAVSRRGGEADAPIPPGSTPQRGNLGWAPLCPTPSALLHKQTRVATLLACHKSCGSPPAEVRVCKFPNSHCDVPAHQTVYLPSHSLPFHFSLSLLRRRVTDRPPIFSFFSFWRGKKVEESAGCFLQNGGTSYVCICHGQFSSTKA